MSYKEGFLYRPSTGEGADVIDAVSPEGNLRSRVKAAGHELIDGLHCAATPGGPTARAPYEELRDELLSCLREAAPVDAVLLFLHGAQLADGYDDCEGDILEHVRAIVGPDIPIGVELDLHANVTDKMTENASIIIACKEYPHTDFNERAGELLHLVEEMYAGRIAPVMALSRIPILGFFHTTREPMRSFVDRLSALEAREGILSVSIAHGFGYADTPNTGASVLVVADDNLAAGQALSDRLADELFAQKDLIKTPLISFDQALDEALECRGGPAVIADTSDNPGGGAAGDSTFALRAMLERGLKDVALAMIWDPAAVRTAERAGEGTSIPIRLGGKTSPMSGDPLDVEATVLKLRNDAKQNAFGAPTPIGPAALLDIDGIKVVINSIREQVHDTACFSEFGIDAKNTKLLVVKSAQHFHASFGAIAEKILYADLPGTVTSDFSSLPYQKITRPIWPLDELPFEAYGKVWQS